MTKPNIILILSDDQPKGLTDAMPFVTSEIKDKGLFVANALAQTALCAPARASILTGLYSNRHGVWTNQVVDNGGWLSLSDNEGDTIATRLKAAGYQTSLVGKYINLFKEAPSGYIPEGWDDFITMSADPGGGAGSYYDYTLDGTIYPEWHGTDPEDYSTDVLRDKAVGIIQNTPAEQPFFLMFAPWAPHGPFTPAPRHKDTWTGDVDPPNGFAESDMSDKPSWMQALPQPDLADTQNSLGKMHETVMAVDEAAQAIVGALGNRLSNTLIIYASDNGKMLGVHRLVKKDMPHKWATEVPCFIRWDGHVTPGANTNRISPNIDITATIAEAAGVTGWAIDGKSILTTNRPAGAPVAQKDNWGDQKHPGYIGWRTTRYLYVEYTDGYGKEFYDYDNDPNELNNLINSNNQVYVDKIAELKAKARGATPYPPGFVLSG